MRLGVRAPRRGRGKVRFPTKNQLPRGSYLTLLGRIPYEAQVVISVLLSLLTTQTKDFPVFSAQEEEFLPMLPTEIFLPPVLWAQPDLSTVLGSSFLGAGSMLASDRPLPSGSSHLGG